MVGSKYENLRAKPVIGALIGVVAVGAFILWPSTTRNQKAPRIIGAGLELGGTQTLAHHALSDESLAATLLAGKYVAAPTEKEITPEPKKKTESKIRRTRVLEGLQLSVRDVGVQTHLVFFETEKRKLLATTLAQFPVKPVKTQTKVIESSEREQSASPTEIAAVDFSSLTPMQRRRLMMSSVEHRPLSYSPASRNPASSPSGPEADPIQERWNEVIAAHPMPAHFQAQSKQEQAPGSTSSAQAKVVWKDSPPPAPSAPAQGAMTVASYNFNKAYSDQSRSSDSVGQETLRGRVELTNGLAFSGAGQSLRVVQKEMGETVAEGTVDVINGTYLISAEVLRKGEIVAELVDQDGHILGIGGLPYERAKIEKNIELKPVPIGIWGQVVSAYGTTGTPWPIAKATLAIEGYTHPTGADADGRFCFDELDPSSSVIVGAKFRGHWDTTTMSTVGEANSLTLFPDSMITALIELSELKPEQRESAKHQGLIWARVLVNDKPMAGAQVWLENQPQAKAVYFNKFQIANPSMSTTSENGLVAIVNVNPGTHLLRARIRSTEMPARLVEVRQKTVTTASFEYSRRSVVPVQVFSSDNRESMPASLSFLGSEKQAFAQSGSIKARVAPGRDPLVVRVESDANYLRVLRTVSRETKNISVVIPPRGEIEGILNSERISVDPGAGQVVILGAVEGTRVLVDQTNVGDTNLIRGKIRGPRGTTPVVILTNIPPGMRSIQTILPGRQRAFVGTHYVAAGETSLVDLGE